ncbi:MAG: DUF5106 domain-containing protein [Bacteroidales bacterium]|jgi:thiol-disulfide isomerase/thioredoxin|nr:DUF5106 domain-containing protein [Bacteroidales bacterium]
MKQFIFIISFLLLALFTGFSCSSSKQTKSEILAENEIMSQTIVPDTFVLPLIPEALTNSGDRSEYLVMHFWDRFDFADIKLIERPEITEQAFVDYINILNYVPGETAAESLIYTLNKAEADRAMYHHFVSLFEKYFYDPNSPFRDEAYYLPVLRKVIQSPLLTDELLSRYSFQLEMSMKNRVGQRAVDFTYTLASGQSHTLHSLNSEFTLLLFSNPGCSTCEAVTAHLDNSKSLNAALQMNSPTRTMLTILTIYPDDDPEEWLAHLPLMPERWVHGYDKTLEITNKKLYDIKAIPTLYLLDKNKNVILKDTSIEAVESFFSVSH